ncbi:MAG: sensor histidine kinase [Armatimonadota bacterium]|nr:sensor histidine kinase [Armatimonadota bacterium]
MEKPKVGSVAFFVLYGILLLSALVWVRFENVRERVGESFAAFHLLIAAAACYVVVRAFLVMGRRVSKRYDYVFLGTDILIITGAVRLTGGLNSEVAVIYLWPVATSAIQRLPARTLAAGAASGVLYAAVTWPSEVTPGYVNSLAIRILILVLAVSQALLYARTEAGRVEESARLREEVALAEYRARLSREMHDGIQHYLAEISVRLEVARQVMESDPVEGARIAVDQRFMVRQAGDELRYLVRLLRSPAVDREGFVGAIRYHLSLFGGRLSISAPLEVEGTARPIPPEVAHCAFRIMQEALMNVEKHAGAGEVKVALRFGDDSLACIVTDDGGGFSPGEVMGGSEMSGGVGLVGMRQRAEAVGGKLEIESSPGRGTRVAFTAPLGE